MSLTFRQMSLAKENSMTRRVSMDYKLTPIKLACKDEEIDLVSLFLFTYGQLVLTSCFIYRSGTEPSRT